MSVAIKKESALISVMPEKPVGFNILGESALIFSALMTCPNLNSYLTFIIDNIRKTNTLTEILG